jgi:hypothetical protein
VKQRRFAAYQKALAELNDGKAEIDEDIQKLVCVQAKGSFTIATG